MPQLDPVRYWRNFYETFAWVCLRSNVCASVSFRDGVLAVTLALGFMQRIAIATPQDRQWRLSSWELPTGCSPFSFQGKLYVAHSFPGHITEVFKIDPPLLQDITCSSSMPYQQLIATCPTEKKLNFPVNLVEHDSEILVVGTTDEEQHGGALPRLHRDHTLPPPARPLPLDLGGQWRRTPAAKRKVAQIQGLVSRHPQPLTMQSWGTMEVGALRHVVSWRPPPSSSASPWRALAASSLHAIVGSRER
uniref:Uncharacterized protein n=1 Tax=Oryza punctata TaxID=4537 RepID=A0A0E0KGX0_ORYPU